MKIQLVDYMCAQFVTIQFETTHDWLRFAILLLFIFFNIEVNVLLVYTIIVVLL